MYIDSYIHLILLMGKKKKGGKKTAKKGKDAANKKEIKEKVLSKEELIKKSISEHMHIIQEMWDFIIDKDSLTDDQKLREKLHKKKCEKNNIEYTPKSSIPFERFKIVIEKMTDISSSHHQKSNQIRI